MTSPTPSSPSRRSSSPSWPALNQQPCGGPAPEGESQETVCNRFALTNTIQQTVVADFAEANDVAVTDKQVSDIVANLDQQLGADKVDEQLTTLKLTRDRS